MPASAAPKEKPPAAVGAVTVDGPTLFLQGALLLVATLSVLLIAERGMPIESDSRRRGLDAFTAQASTVPGTVAELVAAYTEAGADAVALQGPDGAPDAHRLVDAPAAGR